MSKFFLELSRSDLEENGACKEGLVLFDSFAKGETSIVIPWGATEYLWLEKETHFASWLFDCGLAPQPNFAKRDLRGADLRGAYLSGTNLSGAFLSGANLSGACLFGADCSRANLSGAYVGSSPAPEGWQKNSNNYLEKV